MPTGVVAHNHHFWGSVLDREERLSKSVDVRGSSIFECFRSLDEFMVREIANRGFWLQLCSSCAAIERIS